MLGQFTIFIFVAVVCPPFWSPILVHLFPKAGEIAAGKSHMISVICPTMRDYKGMVHPAPNAVPPQWQPCLQYHQERRGEDFTYLPGYPRVPASIGPVWCPSWSCVKFQVVLVVIFQWSSVFQSWSVVCGVTCPVCLCRDGDVLDYLMFSVATSLFWGPGLLPVLDVNYRVVLWFYGLFNKIPCLFILYLPFHCIIGIKKSPLVIDTVREKTCGTEGSFINIASLG